MDERLQTSSSNSRGQDSSLSTTSQLQEYHHVRWMAPARSQRTPFAFLCPSPGQVQGLADTRRHLSFTHVKHLTGGQHLNFYRRGTNGCCSPVFLREGEGENVIVSAQFLCLFLSFIVNLPALCLSLSLSLFPFPRLLSLCLTHSSQYLLSCVCTAFLVIFPLSSHCHIVNVCVCVCMYIFLIFSLYTFLPSLSLSVNICVNPFIPFYFVYNNYMLRKHLNGKQPYTTKKGYKKATLLVKMFLV